MAAVRPAVPNPSIVEACGIDVTLVLDASGSISSAGAVDDVREAAQAFLDALADTSSRARIVDFGTVARQTAAMTLVTASSVARDGVHGQAVADYYDPKPPFPPGVQGWQFRSPYTIDSPSSYRQSNDPQFTNWDAALDLSADVQAELVVFITDGEPNGIVDDQPGDPFFRAGDTTPDIRFGMDATAQARELTLDRAVEEANRIKTTVGTDPGARMLTVGVGDAFDSGAAVDRLRAVTNGPASQVVTDASSITSLNEVDIALIEDFGDLADALRRVVTELCSPSLTIRKLAQTADSAQYVPRAGWSMTVTPTVATSVSPPYRWLIPAGAPVGPQTVVTDTAGFAQFQWEPDPPTAASTASVVEVVQDDYTAGPWSCEARNPDGSVVRTNGTGASFDVAVGPEQIVTCTMRNDFDYQPSGIVTKQNVPPIVRGDGDGSQVVSNYTATNTGNTPLTPVAGTDDQCAPVELVRDQGVIVDDLDADGLLDPGETWQLTCTRTIVHELTDEDVVIDNIVTLSGRDPEGTLVEGQATDDVQVLTPDIHIVKTVDPTTGVAPLDVTYTYEVHTEGNTPIADVVLDDDTPPCETPTFVGGDGGPNPDVLDPGETWIYTCESSDLTASVTNVVDVTGQPVTPDDLEAIGDVVTDTDTAAVEVLDDDLRLTKAADPTLLLPGQDTTYTIVVSNPTTTTTYVPPAGVDRDDLIVDTQCDPVTYASGDTGDDSRLEPAESWTYECTRSYDAAGVVENVAEVTMIIEGTTTETSRDAPALVEVLEPGIAISKRADVGVVYDGDDVTYTYDVSNTGPVSLQDVVVSDDVGPGTCAPLSGPTGDDGNDLLDPGEVWTYTCTTAVSKTASGPPESNPPELVDNTAEVTGTPVLDGVTGEAVEDDDPAIVLVIAPAIALDKGVSEDVVRVGSTVTWTLTATNTGDTPLHHVTIADDTCDPLVLESGDDGIPTVMEVDEAWVFTCSDDVGVDTTNTATVGAIDVLGGTVDDTAQAVVEVFRPDIDLVKSVSDPLVLNGSTVTYTFDATNTGDDPLTPVVIGDTQCEPLVGPTGDTGADGRMDPAETWSWTCDAPITTPTVNIALVSGDDRLGAPVIDVDFATVIPFTTGIEIVKTADPTLVYGSGSVTYLYEVTNTGTVPLADVKNRLVDDRCASPVYVSGDDDGNDLLTGEDDLFETGPPETWIFTCLTTVSVDTLNTAVVTGTPWRQVDEETGAAIAPDVTATDDAFVEVVALGSITIVKQVPGDDDGTFGFEGDLGSFDLATVQGTASRTFDVRPGTFEVVEGNELGWVLANLACVDPTDDSTSDRASRTATIVVDEGESVTCTFENAASAVAPDTAIAAVIAEIVGIDDDQRVRLPAIPVALLAAIAAIAAVVSWVWVRRRQLPASTVAGAAGETGAAGGVSPPA